MENILKQDFVGYILAGLLVVNALLSVVGSVFDAIGKSEKVPTWIAKVASIVAKAIDLISANRKH